MDESLRRDPAPVSRFEVRPNSQARTDANLRTKAHQRFYRSRRPFDPRFAKVFAEQRANFAFGPLAGGLLADVPQRAGRDVRLF
jgi:hypothetical protein